jgi:hypothetical protein
LGIEIRHSTWANDDDGPLGNIIFLRFQVFNKGGNTIENCYLSLWVDPDLGGASDDLVGCDPLTNLGFCYNATNTDNQYGSAPPAIGCKLLQGPAVFTGDATDTARMWGEILPGMKDMGMTAFTRYFNGLDPNDSLETYHYLEGKGADGEYHEYNGEPTFFPYSGDPITGTGYLDYDPADRRFMVTTGPIDFESGDSTEIYAALVIGSGTDRLSSISIMRYNATIAEMVYDSITEPDIPTDVDEPENDLPNDFMLGQNYPNPFNPSTNIGYWLARGGDVNITVYNIMGQKVKTLIDRYLPAGTYNVSWNSNDAQGEPVTSGIYFYRLTFGDRKESRSMVLVR